MAFTSMLINAQMSLEVKTIGDEEGIEEFSLSQFQFDDPHNPDAILTRQTLGTVLVGMLGEYNARGYYFAPYDTGGFLFVLTDENIPQATPQFTADKFFRVVKSFRACMPGSLVVPFAKACGEALGLYAEDNVATFYAQGTDPFVKLHFSPTQILVLNLDRNLQVVSVTLKSTQVLDEVLVLYCISLVDGL